MCTLAQVYTRVYTRARLDLIPRTHAHLDAHNAPAQRLYFDLGQKKTPLNGGASCVHVFGLPGTLVCVRGFAVEKFKTIRFDKFIHQFTADIKDIELGFGLFRVSVHITR